ncbi:5-oxoprolinase subunit PxpA [Lentilactobacillus farraginis]|uniref:5-oxoprolinase subunit A n=1 Tax=Lentilactobacillus farraginis DSM 18382 = JCM 14108 TaxID=1423743 RepID=X0PC92_9LACO|nr:5-oxoprolinase subunit PxpA [Lentilactobacillus farraginis]KRM13095.1 LamB YcsF family protein [Lentilactobacillus farraginis DSM 18382 = JCM 14108]GAF37898.1 lactam utilization protein LamB [Lentilactobacillus farraginis DSM 18382 = JCM 14108]
MVAIDLNSDLGESYGRYHLGKDQQVIPLISACNIACGFHAGDPDVMAHTVSLAEQAGIGVGAHPAFPDLDGFGRRYMQMDLASVTDMIVYQVAALEGFTHDHRLHHVKPHGALYNAAGKDLDLAKAICRGIKMVDPNIIVYGLANSQLIKAAEFYHLPAAEEVFADRNYQADGSLVPRTQPNAVLTDPEEIANRTVQMIQNQSVTAITGETVPLKIDSICVHGDNDQALAIVKALVKRLHQEKIDIETLKKK